MPEEGLPDGWRTYRLGDICEKPQYGWTTSACRNSGGLKLLRTTDISTGNINWDEVPSCENDPPDPGKYILAPGDIVISRAGSVGVSHIIGDCPAAVFASYLIRFRPLAGFDSRYIHYFLLSPSYWDAISGTTTGITIPNVNASKLSEIEIPVPPLPEQKRIVAKLDELMAEIKAAKAHLARAKEILKRFRQAVLNAAVTGKLTEEWRRQQENEASDQANPPYPKPLDWRFFRGSDLFSIVTSGSRGWAKYYSDSGPIFLRMGNLDHESVRIDLQQVQHVRPDASAECNRALVRSNDILISITADVGMVGLVPDGLGETYVNQHVAIARLSKDYRASPEFIAWFLAAEKGGQEQLRISQRGATKTGLGLADLRAVEIPLPSMEEQDEIVRRIRKSIQIAEEASKVIGRILASGLPVLCESALSMAFRGKLIELEPQNG